ncbi:MAG TPA: VOC family protein [Polyangiales bacterium]|jgi:catechol 2,3-dioxygenase-like lactoylglutathione lyase family enzyme|nr:VOC family protein [Polyangiales bacterium]
MTSTTSTESSAVAHEFEALKPRVSYLCYHVDDIERALSFYVGVLGFKELLRLPLGKGEHEVVLNFPNSKGGGLILMWNTERKKPYEHGDSYSRFVISVSDVDAALVYLAKHDVKVAVPAKTAGALRYAIIKDPDGYLVELLEAK